MTTGEWVFILWLPAGIISFFLMRTLAYWDECQPIRVSTLLACFFLVFYGGVALIGGLAKMWSLLHGRTLIHQSQPVGATEMRV